MTTPPPASGPPEHVPPVDPAPPGPVIDPPAAPAPRSGWSNWASEQPTYNPYQDPAYPYGAQQPPAYPDPPSRTMAGWALGLAIVPCLGISTLVAIGLAITVLVKCRDGRNHGKGMAIAALVISVTWLVVIVVANVVNVLDTVTADAERDEGGNVTERSSISVFKLREGDCFDHPPLFGQGEEEVMTADVEVVPCADPHQFEVYRVFELPDGPYPGSDREERSAARRCIAEFEDFVGVPYGRSRLEPYYLYPQSTSWRLLGDHEVTCLVGMPNRTTTGTLGDSRR